MVCVRAQPSVLCIYALLCTICHPHVCINLFGANSKILAILLLCRFISSMAGWLAGWLAGWHRLHASVMYVLRTEHNLQA